MMTTIKGTNNWPTAQGSDNFTSTTVCCALCFLFLCFLFRSSNIITCSSELGCRVQMHHWLEMNMVEKPRRNFKRIRKRLCY